MKDSTHEPYPDPHHGHYSKTVFGFWIYLLTDFMLFAAYFAAYVVLQTSTFGGPGGKEIFNYPLVLTQTLILLTAAFTSGIGGVFAHRRSKQGALISFLVTFVLGVVFLSLQISDYHHLIATGNSWERSAFLTAYFNLVGLHTIHIVFGLCWIIVFLIPLCREGITEIILTRLSCLRMFWQFLAIVWIFIFTIVYLAGVNV